MYTFQIPDTQAAFNPAPPGAPALNPPFTPDGKKTPIFDCPQGGFEFHLTSISRSAPKTPSPIQLVSDAP